MGCQRFFSSSTVQIIEQVMKIHAKLKNKLLQFKNFDEIIRRVVFHHTLEVMFENDLTKVDEQERVKKM